jgi:hypothetical protein
VPAAKPIRAVGSLSLALFLCTRYQPRLKLSTSTRESRPDVPQMNESAAERLDPVRAAKLAQVLDYQSRWENMRADGTDSTAQLQGLQRAFEAYRVRLAEYRLRYRTEQTPDLSPSGPNRLGAWCRTVRAVCRRASEDAECPSHAVMKAFRMADRIADRVKVEPLSRESSPTDMAGAIRQLSALIVWCEDLVRAPGIPPERGGVHEVGDRTA